MNRFAFLFTAIAIFFSATSAQAKLKLPSIFGHHMVLQRDMENPIWGWAEPNAAVSINFAGKAIAAKASANGRWKAKLPSLPGSSHAMNLTITSGSDKITLSNIVMGEVWICSGQSNMQWSVDQSYDPDLEKATANYPNIRLISVPQVGTQEEQDDFDGQWDICTPATVGQFSGVGYFFGRP